MRRNPGMRHNRGIPTEEVLAEMRNSEPPICYLVGTPKSRLSKLEGELIGRPWEQVRPGLDVKLLAHEGELYVRLKAKTASAKSEPCAGADCENSGTGSVNSRQ
jgi:hypothetical protein